MKRKVNFLIALVLLTIILLLTKDKVMKYIGISSTGNQNDSLRLSDQMVAEENIRTNELQEDYFVNDSLYLWDDRRMDWKSIGLYNEDRTKDTEDISVELPSSEPIQLGWKELMDIQYRLRHFEQKQVDMYSPVFGEELKSLNGKKVRIKGFVIPVDEEGEFVALSYGPYSSCYFCGNASPASIITMYMKNKDDRFDLDDYKNFTGTLILNYDNPDEFYYILKDAEEV